MNASGKATAPATMFGEFLPHYVELVQRQMGQYGRIGATRIVQTPDVPAIAASSLAQPQTVNWRNDGIVIAMYGAELAGTPASFASTRVRVQIGGSDDLITDGQSGTYASFLSLFGAAQNWFPLLRKVQQGVQWIVTYQNLNAGGTATPSLSFAFIADDDIKKMAR